MPRLDGVDVLRGLSIFAVVLLHIGIRFQLVAEVHLGKDWPPRLARFVWSNGGNGVTVFFAVSGFLITLTSIRRFGGLKAMRPAVFYRIRFARIMPLLLLLLAVLSVLHLANVDGYHIRLKVFTLAEALFSALTFHLNWLEATRNFYLPACWTVLWSLSIEEMFYLFFPLACVVLLRWRYGIWLWAGVALAFVAMGPFARTVWNTTSLARENSYIAGMASIALGCLTALVADWWGRRGGAVSSVWLRVIAVAGWAMILVIAIWPRWYVLHVLGRSGTDDTVLVLAACLVMLPVALRPAHGSRWSAPVRWLGRHSYEVYLGHEFVVVAGASLLARWFAQGASRGVLAGFVVAIVGVAAGLGWALARFFSEPMNRRLRGARAAK